MQKQSASKYEQLYLYKKVKYFFFIIIFLQKIISQKSKKKPKKNILLPTSFLTALSGPTTPKSLHKKYILIKTKKRTFINFLIHIKSPDGSGRRVLVKMYKI